MIAFAEFLRCVRGEDVTPYPWQERLAARCMDDPPPAVIAVPTGAGKTTTIDALLWALAGQAERPACERSVGVRIVWAIDRRILVDEVYEHACVLARILGAALADPGDLLHEVAGRLAALSGGAPLVATRWRGGLGEPPARHEPLQPQIITSTVAQIGSRLLFRGYGVGTRSLALEAGLAACDTTICLDEAHLAEPFRQTVAAIAEQRGAGEQALALPGLRAIQLTATPPRETEDVLSLDAADRVALGSRIDGAKRARLLEAASDAREPEKITLLADATASYVRDGASTVACVLNTVQRARAVFDKLRASLGEEADVALLIGPQRPADREQVLKRHRGALFEGTPGERPLVCVATQTFEVGLDADVAAMVTESASATALVQRLGRLNRRGVDDGHATIVRDAGCWLYVEDEPTAWEWLGGLVDADGSIDVSVAALERGDPPRPKTLPVAATLTSDVVDLFVQTSPRPAPWIDPDPEAFLRGPEAEVSIDVSICWRSDLLPGHADEQGDEYRQMLLELVPPEPQELLTLKLTSARALLAARLPNGERPAAAARKALQQADVEDAMVSAPIAEPALGEEVLSYLVMRAGRLHRGTVGPPASTTRRRVALATGAEEIEVEAEPISLSALAPGDVLILPTEVGGADEHGLAVLQPRGVAATDVAADLRPNGAPAPVRLTPEALAAASTAFQGRWQRVAQACRATERALAKARGREQRRAATAALLMRLHELLPEHPGLQQIAPGGAPVEGWDVLLREVRPVVLDLLADEALDEEDEEKDDDREEALGDEAGAQTDDQELEAKADERDADSERLLKRVWVLIPTLRAPSDRRERLPGDDDQPPTIDAHARAVGEAVEVYAKRLSLAPGLRATLALAARAHDHGKADARTQAFYRRGVRSPGTAPIAKSEFGTRDPRTAELAARLAGLPRRQRHEIASVAVLADWLASRPTATGEVDRDLALYLVGAHHGLGRPIPAMPEGGLPPQPFAIDAAGIAGAARGDGRDGWDDGAWLARFWRVIERYGAWGAAYLEALLISADRAVSAAGG